MKKWRDIIDFGNALDTVAFLVSMDNVLREEVSSEEADKIILSIQERVPVIREKILSMPE